MILKYLNNYPQNLQNQIRELIEHNKLSDYILNRYPTKHTYQNDKTLYEYTNALKNEYLTWKAKG